jgi:uncharacterized protein HemY
VAAFLEFDGDLTGAADLTRRAADTFRALDDPRRTIEATAQLARICARNGEPAAASLALTEALDRSAHTSTVLEAADLLDAQAWVETAHGRVAEAQALFAQADERRRQVGIGPPQPTVRLRCDQ